MIKKELNDFKRDRILSTAAQLISERGYANTSVEDIASALGATKPFIYYYYGSKAEILKEICLRTISSSNQIISDLVAVERSAAWRLYHIMSGIAELAVADTSGTSIFFREAQNLPEDAAKMSARLRKRFDSVLADLITEGEMNGEFSIPNAKVAAYSVAGMVTWMFTWYRPAGPLSVAELTAIMARLALQTVGVPDKVIAEIAAEGPAAAPESVKSVKQKFKAVSP